MLSSRAIYQAALVSHPLNIVLTARTLGQLTFKSKKFPKEAANLTNKLLKTTYTKEPRKSLQKSTLTHSRGGEE